MAKDKKSFIMYCDWKDTFNELTDDEAGILIKHIFSYVNDENPETDNRLVKIAFANIRNRLKDDLRKYEQYIEKQRENGKRGGRPKNPTDSQKTQPFIEKPKKADSVNDSVSDNVNDSSLEKNQNSDLEKAMLDFKKMRVKIRKPLTERAEQLIRNDLEKYSKGNESIMIQILENSIKNSWQGVFPLKEDKKPAVMQPEKGKFDSVEITSFD